MRFPDCGGSRNTFWQLLMETPLTHDIEGISGVSLVPRISTMTRVVVVSMKSLRRYIIVSASFGAILEELQGHETVRKASDEICNPRGVHVLANIDPGSPGAGGYRVIYDCEVVFFASFLILNLYEIVVSDTTIQPNIFWKMEENGTRF